MKKISVFRVLTMATSFWLMFFTDSWSAQLVTTNVNGSTFFMDTVGYGFVVGSLDLNVSALGVGWPFTGLASTNKVGLWTLGGSLLASVDIAPTATPTGNYAWVSLVSPVRLSAATTYIVGASGNDYRKNGFTTLSSDVTLISAARNSQQGVFSAPALLSGTEGQAIVGPNLTYETVPEPSTYALLLLSGAASLWALRRRKI